ncbi:MAG TPA: hypothetical protein DER09_06425 [Prolixibacteraceae bacterium]|nr:hypothetical protein [Prolixibacteraceae bacterium]
MQKSGMEKKSDFIITYSLFPDDAKTAFEYAVSIWEQLIESSVPIRIKASWRSQDSNVLASAGPSDYYSNFDYAPHTNRFYPIALVEKITGKEISGSGVPDIEATFNKDIKWYYGTDGETPDQLYDFVTVALHEIGHGLGFTGFFFVTGSKGAYGNETIGDAAAFDIMVVDANNRNLLDTSFYELASTRLYNAFVSQALFSNSPSAKLTTPGSKIRLYAPSAWSDGSSIYHLNDDTYSYGNENSLMTHAIGKGEANHDPGPITRGILADIGWKIMKIDFEKPHDIETPKPIDFKLVIKSDIAIDYTKLFVYFSTDSFKTHRDSVLLIQDIKPGQFIASIIPDLNTKRIDYFVSAGDIQNRVFNLPTEAPAELYSVHIGPDNQNPEISHNPPPYFVLNGDEMQISATVTDNVGVDTVFVEYSVNGIPDNSFGLPAQTGNVFKGVFPVPQIQLNDGDIITYRILAIDGSAAKNITVSPTNGTYSFKIEKLFSPITGYFNDFNHATSDFVISDFEIYKAENFLNASLHSPHPYPSPNNNNSSFDFTTMLKYPIILKSGGKMSYDEVVLVEPGEVLSKFGDDDFWDYVIVEGSKDNGKTWLPLADGYDSGSNTVWESKYKENIDSEQFSKTIGIPDWFINHEINLLSNGNFQVNDTILVRFRLYSDPYAHGWGWTIDNLRIQDPVANNEMALLPGNAQFYPNPTQDLLNIEIKFNVPVKILTIEILNIYGQKLESITAQGVAGEYKTNTDFKNLPVGLYIIRILANGESILQKKILHN